MMNNINAIIDLGSKNLKLGVFDKEKKNIYSSEQTITDNTEISGLENVLNILIREAEKSLSTHIDNIVVMYDSSKYYSLDFSIKKEFDHNTSIKKVYNSLIDEAHFLVSQNNFKDNIIHLVVNNIIIDENKKLTKIVEDIKIKSLIIEIKFICLNKILLDNIFNIFKNNNLKILNLYCSSYVKTVFYLKKFNIQDHLIFIDIGHKRSSSLIFNNNKFNFFKSISLGGNNITKDISKVLNLDLDYSEDLKIKFNKLENDILYSYNKVDTINPYSEVLEKNISIDLLKQVIEARLDEIIELVLLPNNSIKNLNFIEKSKLVVSGGGSKLFSKNYNLSINESFPELKFFDENTSNLCEAGLDYHQSDESSFIKTKKKAKKSGFFENFFNLFSK